MKRYYNENWGVEIIEKDDKVFINNTNRKVFDSDVIRKVNDASNGRCRWNPITKQVTKYG